MAKRNNNGNGGAPATPCVDLCGPEVSHQEIYHNPPAWLPEVVPYMAAFGYQAVAAMPHIPRV